MDIFTKSLSAHYSQLPSCLSPLYDLRSSGSI